MKRSAIRAEKLGIQSEPSGSKMSDPLIAGTMPKPAKLLIEAVVPFLAANYDPQKLDKVAVVGSTVEVTMEVVEHAIRQHAAGVDSESIGWGWVDRDTAAEYHLWCGDRETAEIIETARGVAEGRVHCVIEICNRPVFATLSIKRLLALAAEGLPNAPTRRSPDKNERSRAKPERRAGTKGQG